MIGWEWEDEGRDVMRRGGRVGQRPLSPRMNMNGRSVKARMVRQSQALWTGMLYRFIGGLAVEWENNIKAKNRGVPEEKEISATCHGRGYSPLFSLLSSLSFSLVILSSAYPSNKPLF